MDTLKVRMNVSIVSADWSFSVGDEVDLDTDLANAWLECGHATKIKNEKVDKTKLDDAVQYIGFGQFSVHGQIVLGKAEANAAVKEIPDEVKQAYAEKLAKEAAEEAERLAREAEADGGDAEGKDAAK